MGRSKPINDIHLGPIHTVHWPDGRLATNNMWWYEQGYVEPYPLYDLREKWDELIQYQNETLQYIQQTSSAFRELIEDAIRHYTRALDKINLHNSFLELWNLLEKLTGTQNANYGITVKWASFFYKDTEFAQQILNHLRERRNRAIHSGENFDDSEIIIYQIKRFCEKILSFLIARSAEFENLEEYSQFLERSPDIEELQKQIKLREKAIAFRSGKKV
jgi:hypothetical protein